MQIQQRRTKDETVLAKAFEAVLPKVPDATSVLNKIEAVMVAHDEPPLTRVEHYCIICGAVRESENWCYVSEEYVARRYVDA